MVSGQGPGHYVEARRQGDPALCALLQRAIDLEWGRKGALGEENIASTLRDLIRRRNDEGLMEDVRAAAPIVFDALPKVDIDALLRAEQDTVGSAVGSAPGSADAAGLGLDPLAKDVRGLQAELHAYKEGLSWDELGFPLSYARMARRFWPADGHRFFETGEAGEPRFVMPAPGFRALLPEFAWARVGDDVEARLRTLGVPNPDVRTHARGVFWDTERTSISVKPEDAALMMDAVSPLAAVAQKLAEGTKVPPGFSFVRRVDIDGRPTNAVTLPVTAALEMRGVVNLVRTKGEGVADACRERLLARGIARPVVAEMNIQDVPCIVVPSLQARLLLSPAAHGDPAGALPVTRVAYEPDVADYSPRNALFLAEVSDLVYLDPPQIEAYLRAWFGRAVTSSLVEAGDHCAETVDVNDSPVRFVESKATDAQALVAYDGSRNTIVVAFRGTSTWRDVLSNAAFWLTDGSAYGGGDVHGGFAEQLRSIAPTLEASIDHFRRKAKRQHLPAPTVMVTGHSLGGALAVLFAGRLMLAQGASQDWCEGLRLHNLYTFGQPAVGDVTFCQAMERELAGRGAVLFRFVNGQDIVPRIPPFLENLPLEVRIDTRGRIVPPKRGRSGEGDGGVATVDTSDQDEMRWGLSTSFDDHSLDHYIQLIRKGQNVRFDTRHT
ncbi:MAG: lipase family protein [Deltaproteobacteria bacterium]|nr:lipase family protein [Deltaproteobacteria bacterium]